MDSVKEIIRTYQKNQDGIILGLLKSFENYWSIVTNLINARLLYIG